MNILLLCSFAATFNPAIPFANKIVSDSDSLKQKEIVLPEKYLTQVKQKSDHFSTQIDHRTTLAINRCLKYEKKMQARLMKTDSSAAKRIFSRSIDKLNDLKTGLNNKTSPLSSHGSDSYTDSLQNTLNYLNASDKITGSSLPKLAAAKGSVDNLQNSLQQADQLKAYLREQKQQLKSQLSTYAGFTDDLRNLNKETYYYGEQVKEYRAALSDKKKAEQKAIALLKTIPEYNSYIKQNSRLAGLFGLIGSSNGTTDLSGLQTRSQVEQLITSRIGSSPGTQEVVSQQLSQAKSQLNELKDKYSDVGNAADMPDFKPNPMKTKSFLQRLEFGGNVQFQRSGSYFPATTDLAGQVGYKFHKNGTAGIGLSYKLGMGSGWEHIAFSHQGVGLRSYIDWKLKGTFYVNGGLEENYLSAITHLSQIANVSGWQGSALLGISKKYKVNSKLNGNIMVLYDFLASKNFPTTSSFKLRFGYTM